MSSDAGTFNSDVRAFSYYLILFGSCEYELNSAHGSVATSLSLWVKQLDFLSNQWWIENDLSFKIGGIVCELTSFDNFTSLVLFPVSSIIIRDDETVHGFLAAAIVFDLLNDQFVHFVGFLLRNGGCDPEIFATFLVGTVKTICGV